MRIAAFLASLVAFCASCAAARADDPLCTATYSDALAQAGAALRFGIDPGIAGSAGGVQLPSAPDDPSKDLAATTALRPAGRILVARLNRLFWSDGEAGIAKFKTLVRNYTGAGIDVELQVRYHPASAEQGDLVAWRAWVRHVVDAFGANPRVVAMTITNEVNVTFSPNTSDGAYRASRDALIEGIEAAHDEARLRRFRQLQFGFTYAYRFSPSDDASFFRYLATHGGSAFRAALGFVGLDFYPGSVYPPAMRPGDSYRTEMAQALGTMRNCYLGLASIGRTVPIWLTENGVPTGANMTEAQQADALRELVQGAHDYSGTFNVSDYRWFNLRDSRSASSGSLPGAAATFGTDGLLRDDYTRKPSFAAYAAEIAALGRHVIPGPCRVASLVVSLPSARHPIVRASLYIGRHRVAAASGHKLRRLVLHHPPGRSFTATIVVRLASGQVLKYTRAYALRGCSFAAGPARLKH